MNDRAHLIRLVHIGAKRLGMADEARRVMQRRVGEHESCKDMSDAQLRAVIRELNRLGAKLSVSSPRAAGDDRAPLLGKLMAVMAADGHSDAYVFGISRRMFGSAAPQQLGWHTPDQVRKLVAALMYARKRKAKGAA